MKEIWKDIKDYEGLYKVSNLGRVKSLDIVDRLNRTFKGKIRKAKFNNRGYEQIALYKNGNQKYFLVHRLVAQAFIPNPDNLPQVNHLDQNNKNNNSINLEWCTNNYNAHFGDRIARCGIKHRKAITAYKGDAKLCFDSITVAQKSLGIATGAISAAIRRNGTAKGYRFEYS